MTGRITVSAETAYPALAAGPRVRLVGFAEHLAALGVELRYRPMLTDSEYAVISAPGGAGAFPRKAVAIASGARRALRVSTDADLTLVHRLRSLTPIPGVEPLRHVDVYDFDDALFVGSTLPWNRGFSWLKREAARCRAYLGRARLVIAGNAYLADHARAWADRVEVIPSCVEPARQPLRRHSDREVVRVGWVGSDSTAPYLDPLIPVFERLNASRQRARLVLVGAGAHLRAPWIDHRPWSAEAEVLELADFDIGVMPIPDDPWTRGKCGYKLLQFFAAGVPAIASPVGVNTELVDSERGRLASTDDEWTRALEELIGGVGVRRELGAAGRAFVEREYSYERWAPELADLFDQL
ncbi:MAG: glycosyltransferase family 4 protein [Solirubrobacterales bacterium]